MRITPATRRLADAARPYERAVLRYVCPIYAVSGSTVDSIGSGFLLQLSSVMLLVTAAHVLEYARSGSLHIPAENRAVPIEGDFYVSARRDAVNDARFGLDLGFVVLRTSEMVARPITPALELKDIDIADVPAPRTAYGFAGVPSSKNPRLGDRFDGRSYFYGGLASARKAYDRLGFLPASHFLMRFKRKQMIDESGRLFVAPDPHGMSGGPVFRLGAFEDILGGTAHPQVIAVGIECPATESVLVGVRIGLIADAARQLIPALASELPRSPYVEAHATLFV